LQRKWIAFQEIADWCARESGSVLPDEMRRERAYRDLRIALLKGDFGADDRTSVHIMDPENEFFRLKFADAQHIAADPSDDGIRDFVKVYLRWCWIPCKHAVRWFEARRMPLPPWLEEAKAAAAPLRASLTMAGPPPVAGASDRLRRGPPPVVRERIAQRMVVDYTGKPDILKKESLDSLTLTYRVSRETVKRARQLALEQLSLNSSETLDTNK
jgi:hypothetical protein